MAKKTTQKWKRLCEGIRYYDKKKEDGSTDRYYVARWKRDGKRIEEGLGWRSAGIKEEDLKCKRPIFERNYRFGNKPTTFKEEGEIKKAKEVAQKELTKQAEHQSMTMRSFFEQHLIPWKERRGLACVSGDKSRFYYRINEPFGDKKLTDITVTMLEDFQVDLEQEVAPATVVQVLGLIRQIYNRASRTFLGDTPVFSGSSPMNGIDIPKVGDSNARILAFTHEEIYQILNKIEDIAEEAATNYRMRCWYDLHNAITISLYCGLRLNEIQRLRWDDINFSTDVISIKKRKNAKPGGFVSLHPIVADMLIDRELYYEKEELVFPPLRGGKHRAALSANFKKILDELGINDGITDRTKIKTFHSLRHTYASWLAEEGMPIYHIQKLMRHKTPSMTQRYAHLSQEILNNTVIALRHYDPAYRKAYSKSKISKPSSDQ